MARGTKKNGRVVSKSGPAAPSIAELGVLLCLQLMAEGVPLLSDPDADGSTVFGRAHAILGEWAMIDAAAASGAGPRIRRLRAAIDRAEPVLARVARPVTPPS